MQPVGEVKECGHCSGTGFCSGGENACRKCAYAAGHNDHGPIGDVLCSACGGKGFVWIGPEIVQIQAPTDQK